MNESPAAMNGIAISSKNKSGIESRLVSSQSRRKKMAEFSPMFLTFADIEIVSPLKGSVGLNRIFETPRS